MSSAQRVYDAHQAWAWVVVVSNGLAGGWALGAHRFGTLRRKALWWFTGVAQMTLVVQVVLGVILVNRYEFPFPQFHAFYGFVGIIAAAIIYSYRTQMRHRLYLLYGFGSLFVMGLSIRAMLLGQLG